LPELRTLEENLQAPGFDRKNIRAIAEELKISGLEQFLERMV
jgi:Spy/CpxP family protein refolding chaperone